MEAFLEIVKGPTWLGKSVWLRPGSVCRFGSDPDSELFLPDVKIPRKAGTIVLSRNAVHLVSASGVKIGAREAAPIETLLPGDKFSSGKFTISVHTYSRDYDPAQSSANRFADWMRNRPGTLFAILDAARSPTVLNVLQAVNCRHSSLFNGRSRTSLAGVAPYLLEIPKEGSQLEFIMLACWKKGWACFLVADESFERVRDQLRRSLMVKMPGGRMAYFRFFDPEILRGFLPALSPHELRQFSGSIAEFIVERIDLRDHFEHFRIDGQKLLSDVLEREEIVSAAGETYDDD